MSGPLDAVGQPLRVGDQVAHVTARRSLVNIQRREIIEISGVPFGHPAYRWLIRLSPQTRRMNPPILSYNLVKINPQEPS